MSVPIVAVCGYVTPSIWKPGRRCAVGIWRCCACRGAGHMPPSLDDLAIAPRWLAHSSDDIAYRLFAILQDHGGLKRYVRPSIAQLARETRHARQTIYNALARLIAYGVLAQRTRPDGLKEWRCLIDMSPRSDSPIGVAS